MPEMRAKTVNFLNFLADWMGNVAQGLEKKLSEEQPFSTKPNRVLRKSSQHGSNQIRNDIVEDAFPQNQQIQTRKCGTFS